MCNDDEECAAAAVKEARNPATNFLWTQLRALASLMEQRSWHRRALARAEAAVREQHVAIGQAPVRRVEALSAAALEAANGLDEDEEDEEGELQVGQLEAPSQQQNGRLRLKHNALVSHPIQITPEKTAAGMPQQPSHRGEPATDADQRSPAAVSAGADDVLPTPEAQSAISREGTAPGAAQEQGEGAASAPQEAARLSLEDALAREREVAAADDRALEQILKDFDERLGRIHDALAPNALLILASGQGDTAEVRRLQV